MKTLNVVFIIFLSLFSQVSFGAVDSKKIKKVADELSKILPSGPTAKVKPASPLLMLKEMSEDGDDFNYDPETALDPDSAAWAIVKMSDVVAWIASSQYLNTDSETGEEIKNSPDAKAAVKLIKSLVGTGVVFGAAPLGAVQCGVTFPALLLMDTDKGLIYVLHTEGSGC